MKLKTKSKIVLLLTFEIVLALSAVHFCNLYFAVRTSENNNAINFNYQNLKISKISGKIHIDDTNPSANWSAAKIAGICTGSGTYSDPYVIEDLIIDGGGTGSGIWIQNSIKYFRIENCTIYNSDIGIHLWPEAHNGTLVDNNCSSNNVYGIEIEECKNCTVSGNILENNGDGIHVKVGTDITISGNTANNNSGMGMYLEICSYLDVLNNDVNYNGWVGLYLGGFSYGTVKGNTINNNAEMGGIALGGSRNVISENIVSYNNYSGIHGDGNVNNFSKNTANYNAEHGISFGGDGSILSENTANHNAQMGIYLNGIYNNATENTVSNNGNYGFFLDGDSSDCILHLNYIMQNSDGGATDDGTDNEWDNGTIGNSWDDYSGKDANDDGIGDTPYAIEGAAGSQDNFPIFWDPPVVSIVAPIVNETFKSSTPEYSLSVEGVPITMWYTIDGVSGTFSITNLTGTIDQDAWDDLDEGDVTITFYVQDSEDEIGSDSITIKKSIPEEIPGYNLFFVIFTISVAAILLSRKIKKS